MNKNARSEKDLELPQMKQEHSRSWDHELKRIFPNFAQASLEDRPSRINGLSACCDNQSFVSSDDFQILLWNIENTKNAYKILDIKPDNYEEVEELLTSISYHPYHDHQMIASSTNGYLRLCDLRTASSANDTAMLITENPSGVFQYELQGLLASISSAAWLPDGRHILTRGFLNVKLWDINMPNKPVDSFVVYSPIKSKLSELAMNDMILERFNVSPSPCGNYFTTGLFNNNCFVTNIKDKTSIKFDLNFSKKSICRPMVESGIITEMPEAYNYNLKVENCLWHPVKNSIACTSMNSLFVYNGI